MQLDFAARELILKLVYYGPALSGKTTNLQALHKVADDATRGRLMTLETRDDRTLFFDLLPLTFRGEGDIGLRLKVFTVPGQVIHASTRRLVLQGADGVAFIADSQLAETQNNATAFVDLRDNLKANGKDIAKMPVVIQFNKRDLPAIRSDAELAQMAARGREPVFAAVAMSGLGVVETFVTLLYLTYQSLDAEHKLTAKFGIDGAAFLDEVARKLGARGTVASLIARRVGGGGTSVPPLGGAGGAG